MDYNYVRMRNAQKAGDDALAESYRRLYEAGTMGAAQASGVGMLDYIIVLLGVIAIALGIYIGVSAPNDSTETSAIHSVICEV